MIQSLYARLKQEIHKVYVGDDDIIRVLIIALLSGGHVLVEGMPGFAKTTITKTLAQCISGSFKRIQFSKDLVPADITGTNAYHEGKCAFVPGPLFTHVLLANEVNRAPERVQNLLFEAMNERQITVEARTYALKKPFLVLATQMIDEDNGIMPLTDSQLDRFAFRICLKEPSLSQELVIMQNAAKQAPELETIITTQEVTELVQRLESVLVHDNITRYIVDIVRATRECEDFLHGASPRAGTMLLRASQALALLHGRMYVTAEDVKWVAPYVINHRLKTLPSAYQSVDEIMANIIATTCPST